MKSTTLITVLFIMAFAVCNAQSGVQKKADELFGKFAYAKAIPEYEQMVVDGKNTVHAYKRLAECYLFLRDFEKSLPYFERFIDDPDTSTSYFFKYATALKSAGQGDEALKWFKKYKKFHKNDSRLKQFLKDGSLASVVFNSNERYDVKPVHFNTEYSEFGAFLHEGDIYFSSSRPDGNASDDVYGWNAESWLDIYHVRADDENAVPVPIQGDINTKFHESSLVFSTDHRNDTIAYFTRNSYFNNEETFYTTKDKESVENLSNLKIYKAEKENNNWKVTRNMKMNADHFSTGHPSVNSNRTKIYFASDRPGGFGGSDIYYASIHERGGILEIKNAGPIVNTPGNELFPFINNEGQLFFSSDGHVGFGQLDVFGTVLNDVGKIIDIINLGKPLNSEKDDFGYYALDNGVDGYVSSNRKGGKGGDDIYKFQFIPSLTLEGQVTDAINLRPLDSVKISLYNKKTGTLIEETMTNDNGYYKMLIKRKMNYKVVAFRSTHPEKTIEFETHGINRETKKITKNIQLEPVMDVKVLADLNKIYFDFNKSNIRPDAALELDKVVKLMLQTYPELIIRLESHTDPVGSDQYNRRLSESRAKSTYEYLIQQGVPSNRILSYQGFGESRPVNDCKTKFDCPPELLELNRRTEFPIVQFNSSTQVLTNRR